MISIHALREESDYLYFVKMLLVAVFQSTLSVRRATSFNCKYLPFLTFQSTLSVRRATDFFLVDDDALIISIHALREESDEI